MLSSPIRPLSGAAFAIAVATTRVLAAQVPPADDPLIRMPGTQPGQVTNIRTPDQCQNCHEGYDPAVEPAFLWRGSMMAQAARDPIFWATVTVAGQDSVWALGRPNATDLCLRCHLPEGWLEGRSDPTNGQAMVGYDFDGVHCGVCHRAWDPFFGTVYDGTREGSDWEGYWDETGASATPSQAAADATRLDDAAAAATIELFDGEPLFDGSNRPVASTWEENGAGQLFVSPTADRRASFADANANHALLYSRYHKSKFFCGSCHDVSNPALHNLAYDGTPPGDGSTVLPSETDPAYSYFHVERTFSEFMLSAFAQPGGAAGSGAFAPEVFDTSRPGDLIATCQDCHMPDASGKACNKTQGVLRPTESTEHPKSGVPRHDLVGGNAAVPWLLASTVAGSTSYDATNEGLLDQGGEVLTLDLDEGLGLSADALLAGSDRAVGLLGVAATLESLAYDPDTGALSVRLVNHTGHKLPSGYPEGRRIFVNVRLFASDALVFEVNPYSGTAGTLKGLPGSPSSPPLGAGEAYVDELVYEAKLGSTLTGETETFHFVLGDHRYKDNRVPPRGFSIAAAPARLSEPVWAGASAPSLYTSEEYAGGYDDIGLSLPAGADHVEARLYYQTTSREYAEFLRDEINGTADTLFVPTPAGAEEAYIVQTDPFFSALKAWGDTIWQLWQHNLDVAGIAPVLMTEADLDVPVDGCPVGAQDLVLSNLTVSTTATYEACTSITAGPAFLVDATGDLTFRAGDRIVLASGFSVAAGGTFEAEVDPSLLTSAARAGRLATTRAHRILPMQGEASSDSPPVRASLRDLR